MATQFAVGCDFAAGSDHITYHESELTGNYDNVVYDTRGAGIVTED